MDFGWVWQGVGARAPLCVCVSVCKAIQTMERPKLNEKPLQAFVFRPAGRVSVCVCVSSIVFLWAVLLYDYFTELIASICQELSLENLIAFTYNL